MSRHWDPRAFTGRRRAARLPDIWRPWRARQRRRPTRVRLGEIALAGLGGVALGLAIATVDWSGASAPAGLMASRAAVHATPAAVRVIDGDTFDYGGMRVRVADIDTPEVHGRCADEIALAARATRRMRALLNEGPFELHRLASGRDEDRYGRKLRIVTRGGRSIGDQLVSEGLARTWSGRREPWC